MARHDALRAVCPLYDRERMLVVEVVVDADINYFLRTIETIAINVGKDFDATPSLSLPLLRGRD